MPLSDSQLRFLTPKEQSYKVSDFEGLYILVKPSGSKLWQFKYRMHGKERLLSVGQYPDVSLAQARKAKEVARAQVAEGIDPSEAKQEAKAIAVDGAFTVTGLKREPYKNAFTRADLPPFTPHAFRKPWSNGQTKPTQHARPSKPFHKTLATQARSQQ